VKDLLLNDLLSTNYVIYYNGALVINEKESYRMHTPLDGEIVNSVLSEVDLVGGKCFLSIECEDGWFCFEELLDQDRALFKLTPGQEPKVIRRDSIAGRHVTKVLFRHDEHVRHIPGIVKDRATTLITDRNTLVQITALKATKEAAVEQVLKALNIRAEDTMVFGDDYNDLGLFKYCGYPVAMGNAIPELKGLATMITLSNDDEGVALVIEDLLNAKKGGL